MVRKGRCIRRAPPAATVLMTDCRPGRPTPRRATLPSNDSPLAALAPLLRCPHCGAPLEQADRVLACEHGHSFDVARQGHVALLPAGRRIAPGDSSEMVAARETFLGAGHYSPLAAAVVAAAQPVGGTDRAQCLVDLGAGTGYFLAELLDELGDGLGLALDSSRSALRRAMRAHPRIAAIYCDVWQGLPLQDGAADLAVNVFAPRNGPEIARILSPGGALVVAMPAAAHLHQLVSALGMLRVDADKQARLRAGLPASLVFESRRHVEFDMTLGPHEVQALVAMGPSAHHLDAEDVRRHLARAFDGHVRVTASVLVETFRRD
jgi:23S rRNA (guanine745-N1)-methyltransferase